MRRAENQSCHRLDSFLACANEMIANIRSVASAQQNTTTGWIFDLSCYVPKDA